MSFPDLGDNDIQISNDYQNTNTNYMNMNNDMFGGTDSTNLGGGNLDGGFTGKNNMSGGMNYDMMVNMGSLEDQKRDEERRKEEDERRAKMNERMSKEQEDKQSDRLKAHEWLRNWEDQRHHNLAKKKHFNVSNEELFIKNREEAKQGKTNPWDKVIENIQLKESDYKGTKDISRMKSVILQRKSDFINMKMK